METAVFTTSGVSVGSDVAVTVGGFSETEIVSVFVFSPPEC
jgi:hypothetical protein